MFSLQCKVLIVLLLFLSLFVRKFARGQTSTSRGGFTVQLLPPAQRYMISISGENITIRCMATSDTAPYITWRRIDSSGNWLSVSLGQDRISQSRVRYNVTTRIAELKISNVMASDHGRYRCIANTVVSPPEKPTFQEKAFSLTVHDPVNIILTLSTLEVSTTQSSEERVTCTATGIPEPSVSWMRNGREVVTRRIPHIYQSRSSFYSNRNRLLSGKFSASSSLILSKFRLSDAGVYTCVSSNAVTNPPERRSFTVIVIAPVRVELSAREITIVKGEGGSVRCTAYGYPTPSIQWLNSQSNVPASFVQDVFNNETVVIADMQFSNVQITDAGTYACFAKNNDSEVGEFFHVIVLVPVSVNLTRSTMEVSTSQSFPEIVTCTASGFPRPSISWRRDGQAVSFNASSGVYQINPVASASFTREISVSSSLILSKVDFTDEGVYDCVASNDATEAEARRSLKLTVVAPPSVNISSRKIEILRGESDVVRCTSSGVPLPNSTWFRNGAPVVNSGFIRQDRRMNESTFFNDLIFKKVRNEEAGTYECRAIHRESTSPDVKILIVEILAPASVRLSSQSITIPKGGDGTVRCTAFGVPRPTVSWLRNGSPVVNSQNIIQHQTNFNDSMVIADLVFQDVRLEEAGTYECRGSNRISSSPDVKFLTVEVLGERMRTELQQHICNTVCDGNKQ